MKLSNRVTNLSDSVTLQINAKAKLLTSQGKRIINLSAGEPDLDTPKIVREKAKEAIDKGYTKYTPVAGIKPLKSAIVKRFKKKYGIILSEDCVLVSTGAKQAISNIIETLCGPGDEVIIPVPYWASYPETVKISLAEPVFIDTTKTGFTLTAESLEKAITERTKLLILNSPSNPTGAIYPSSLLKEIASIVKEKNILCLSDEIYDELVYGDEKSNSMLMFTDTPLDNIAVVNGVSKTFSMTGWRLGYAIASPPIIKGASKIQAHTTSGASSISQYAALSALEDAESFINEIRTIFDKRRKLVIKLLSGITDISFVEPKGAFYIFFDVSKFYNEKIKSSVEMAEYLLDSYNVAIVPGAAFGDDKSLRLSYTLSLENLEEGIERLKNGFANVHR